MKIIRRHIEEVEYSVNYACSDESRIAFGSDVDDMPIYIYDRDKRLLVDSYGEAVDVMYNEPVFDSERQCLIITRYL